MTGPQHYDAAQQLLDQAALEDYGTAAERSQFAAAQVHATLALAAATALSHVSDMIVADHDAWCDVASERPATPDRAS